jgi:DNA-binding NarL/FixJ family response regulator
MTIRIAIAEDQRMVRELLTELLRRETDFTLDGEAATGAEAIVLGTRRELDVLVLDVGLPDIDGMEVTRRLRSSAPRLKILALSAHSSRFFVQQMLKAGADGYVAKSSAVRELVQAIRAVAHGKVYLSPDIARQALPEEPDEDEASLAPREREVLALLAEGKRSIDIASRMQISTATVEAHRRNIMRKLGLHTVAELTKYAIRKGLTSL